MSISEARDVRVEGTMRETSIAVGRLGDVSLVSVGRDAVRGALLANGSIEVLHTEQMRGDQRVPPVVRENSRCEGFKRALTRHEARIEDEKWSAELVRTRLEDGKGLKSSKGRSK